MVRGEGSHPLVFFFHFFFCFFPPVLWTDIMTRLQLASKSQVPDRLLKESFLFPTSSRVSLSEKPGDV